MSDFSGIDEYAAYYSPKEKWDYHTITVILPAGEGEYPRLEVECRGGDKDDCSCTTRICAMKDQIDQIGAWDGLRAAADIPLAKLSARMDWSDPEEPWIEVEP